MSQRSVFALLLLVWGIWGCSASIETTAKPDRPNIVLILADDISPDFGVYGVNIDTPHIDRLAREGLLFTNAYVTASSCSPSRNSLITGRYPHNHGAPELHMPLPPGQFAFPGALREAGYYTLAAGKWHMGPEPKAAFDKVNDISYPDDYTGAATWIPELRTRPKDQPFFFWLAAFDAHRPWEPDADPSPVDRFAIDLPPGVPDTPASREDYGHYLDEVRRFDRIVGQVVSELETQGVLDHTLLIVTSDNGRPFPRNKTSLYDGGMRTPLLMRWPAGNVKAGGVSHSLVSFIDIAPTLLDVAGVSVPDSVQGLSLASVLDNPQTTPRTIVFGERNWHTQRGIGRMVRKGNFVYIRDFTPTDYSFQIVDREVGAYAELLRLRALGALTSVEAEAFSTARPTELLFDVSIDPQQTNNLVGSAAHRETLQELRSLLAEWRERTGDSIAPLEQLTPDRTDRTTFEALYPGARPGGRPSGGVVPGEAANATTINDPGPR